MSAIQIRPERCGACNLCVLACSFHHIQAFSRRRSSIDILKNETEGSVEIVIREVARDGRIACDGCSEEDSPLCAEWCPVGAIRTERMKP